MADSLAPAKDMSGANDIPFFKLLMAFGVIVVISGFSWKLELGNADQLIIAGIRAFVQLSCLGFILHPIFTSDNPVVVFAYIFGFMILVSAYEAAARPKVTYPGIFWNSVCSLGTSLLTLGALLLAIVAPTPWYNAQYLIPLAGMLINNSLSSVAVALNQMLDHLTTNKVQVEALLAFGASPWEAAWPGFVKSAQAALIPAINGMNVIGLVSIPGMMTGQILGGASPMQAANYQIVITLVISGCTFMSLSMICMFTIRAFFDARGRHDTQHVQKQTRLKVSQCFDLKAWRRPKVSADGSPRKEPLLASEEVARTSLALRPDTSRGRGAAGHGAVVLKMDVHGLVANARPLNVRLDLHAGETACIMGPSGIGKTTLLKWICDLTCPQSAAMSLHGKEGKAFSPQAWRRDVLYVQQSKAPLPGTPTEFIQSIQRLGVNRGRPTFDPVPHMKALGLPELMLERPWNELSGGEAQRTMLSIALATAPACVLLDEPTSALDDASKVLVESRLQAMDCCVLLVTHDEAQADRVGTSVWRIAEQ